MHVNPVVFRIPSECGRDFVLTEAGRNLSIRLKTQGKLIARAEKRGEMDNSR
jgi:hypothetical protein